MTLPTAVRVRSCCAVALCLVALVAAWPARAQTPDPNSQGERAAERDAALAAGFKAGTRGPAKVALLDQASLALPDGYMFVPREEATRILRALGNTVSGDALQGLVFGTRPSDHWIVVVRYIKDGYIKDDEAKDWNADELLKNLSDGNDEANKDRVARGFAEVEIVGWIEKPTYDAPTHRLVWSLSTKHKGEPADLAKGINYNTHALGRDGYFSLNLLTNSDRIAGEKAVAHTLLAALAYNPGKAYEDFDAATDRVALYGIAALVGGIAAKKLGLLALIGAFVLKFAKVIAIGVAAFVGGVWKFLGRRRERV